MSLEGMHTHGPGYEKAFAIQSESKGFNHFQTVFIQAGCALSTVLILNKLSIIDKIIIIDYRLQI